MLIGSYSYLSDQKSDFSNYGKFVDFYAIGENVFVTTPFGFYLPVKGTSMSTPLAVRFLTENHPGEKDPLKLREHMMNALVSKEKPFLPAGPYARYALFEHSGNFQLTDNFWKHAFILKSK